MSREISRSIVISSQIPDCHYSVVFANNIITVYLYDANNVVQEIQIPADDARHVGRAILDILPR